MPRLAIAIAGTSNTNSTTLLVKLATAASADKRQDIVRRNGGSASGFIARLNLLVVDVPFSTVDQAAASYRTDKAVQRVESNRLRKASGAASDPAYGEQWALPRIGWEDVHGVVELSGSPVIAVLDTGVDSANPDLAGRLVDGYSALVGGSPGTDPNGHGTWLATIAAGTADNDAGIAGVAYAGASVMPVQVLGADGTGQDSDIIAGIVAAADAGADVILMGFSNPGYSQSLQDAIDYAWSKDAVLVASAGNDGSPVAAYPAGASKVMGVSATDLEDGLWSGSNFGAATYIAAPGTGIVAGSPGGGTATITGTSPAAAIVAGSAALIRSVDPGATNAVISGRLARSADPSGTPEETGNGRVNLARAIADTSTEGVVPAGAGAGGGPLVGPYVADAGFDATLEGQDKGSSSWDTGNLTGWLELDLIPTRVLLENGPITGQQIVLEFDHTKTTGGTVVPGIENLTSFTTSGNVSITAGPTLSAPAGQDKWSYTFTVNVTNSSDGWVQFNSRMAAGAHYQSGSSLALGGTPSLGTLQVFKPAAASGSPDLSLTKTGPTTATQGSTITYTLNYSNKAAATSSATGVQLRDMMPSSVAYVAGSCTAICTVTGNTVTWDLGTLAAGASGSQSYQVTVNSGAAVGSTFTNSATVRSAENDALLSDNNSSVTTTVQASPPPNRAPSATQDAYSTAEDTPLTVSAPGVLANDSDADSDPLTAIKLTNPTHGTVTLNADGSFTYTPGANYNGPDSFTYKANDGSADSNVATVSLTVNPVNDPPDAVDDSATLDEDSSGNAISVLTNDSFAPDSGETLAVTAVSQGANGSVTFTASNVTYTPAPNFNGSDTFTYTISDGNGGNDTATVTVTVNSVNDLPVAVDDAYWVNEDSVLVISGPGVLGNDSDADGSLSALAVSSTAHGLMTLTSDGSFTYLPHANYNGADSFTYKANDGSADSNVATVSLTVNPVNDAPVAVGDSYAVDEDDTLIVAASGVLANDSDIDGHALTAIKLTNPTHGTVTLNADGSFTYTPGANYNGADSFTYKANDGSADSNVATVSLTVNPVNDPPDAVNDSATLDEDSSGNAISVLANDTFAPDVGETLTVTAVTDPAHGSASLTASRVLYTPDPDYFGSDSFDYTITDGNGGYDSASVNVSVTNVNDAPFFLPLDGGNTKEVAWGNLLSFPVDAADIENNELTFSLVGAPTGASIGASTGQFNWTPESSQIGSHSMTIHVADDGSPALGADLTLTVNVGKRATSLIYHGDTTGQYSDPAAVKATLIDDAGGALDGMPLDGKTVSFTLGTQSTSDSTSSTALAESSITLNQAAVNTTVNSAFTADSLYLGSNDSDPFSITKESASITYTGDTLVSTTSTGNSTAADVRLSAVISEAADGNLGDKLNTTSLKFTVFRFTDTTMTSPVASCTAAVNSIGAGQGSAECNLSLTADNYTVKVELLTNGYYTAPVETYALTVVQPGTGFSTGGGWLNEPNLGSRSNFGFTVKYLKNGNVQGNSLYIYRMTLAAGNPYGLPAGDYNWIIKSNAMQGLVQSCTNTAPKVCTATFTGKNSITAVDRTTGVATGLGGNYQFQIDVTDRREPSATPTTPDSYAIRVWNPTTPNYYKMPTPTQQNPATQQPVAGGNIQVRL